MRAVTLTAVLIVGAASVWQGLSLREVRSELARVGAALERIEARQEDLAERRSSVTAAAVFPGASLPAPVPRFDPPAPSGADTPAAPAATAEQIADLVDRKVEARLKEHAKKKDGSSGDRKMPLGDLAKELGLDPGTQTRAAEIANATKKEILDLAKTQRPDGTSMADDLVDAMLKGDEKAARSVFARLFTEKVPGTDSTYVLAVSRIQERANKGLESVMGPDAYTRFSHMNLKPENIETGFDPWAEYARQRAAK